MCYMCHQRNTGRANTACMGDGCKQRCAETGKFMRQVCILPEQHHSARWLPKAIRGQTEQKWKTDGLRGRGLPQQTRWQEYHEHTSGA